METWISVVKLFLHGDDVSKDWAIAFIKIKAAPHEYDEDDDYDDDG
jgi:hypothetical protein